MKGLQLALLIVLAIVLLFQSSKLVEWKNATPPLINTPSTDRMVLPNNQSTLTTAVPLAQPLRLQSTGALGSSLLTPEVAPIRDIHIVMIGDSVMRYQYLSLVYRLRHGIWFNSSQWYYDLVHENSFANPYHNHTWGEFLYQTNRVLQPNEVCDCYRQHVPWMGDILENRYYYDSVLNNSVSYLLAYGHQFAVVGRLKPQEVRNQSSTWQTKAFQEYKGLQFSWIYRDWSELIRDYIRYLDPKPRHIVMNAGLWLNRFGWFKPPTSNETGVLSNDTINLLAVMNETPEYNYVWRTTTYWRNRRCGGVESDPVMCEHLHNCVNVSFTKHLRMDLYWDDGHFFEPYYRAANEEMLETLGYLPDRYVRMNLSDILE